MSAAQSASPSDSPEGRAAAKFTTLIMLPSGHAHASGSSVQARGRPGLEIRFAIATRLRPPRATCILLTMTWLRTTRSSCAIAGSGNWNATSGQLACCVAPPLRLIGLRLKRAAASRGPARSRRVRPPRSRIGHMGRAEIKAEIKICGNQNCRGIVRVRQLEGRKRTGTWPLERCVFARAIFTQ